jgi:hypothetical protein
MSVSGDTEIDATPGYPAVITHTLLPGQPGFSTRVTIPPAHSLLRTSASGEVVGVDREARQRLPSSVGLA